MIPGHASWLGYRGETAGEHVRANEPLSWHMHPLRSGALAGGHMRLSLVAVIPQVPTLADLHMSDDLVSAAPDLLSYI